MELGRSEALQKILSELSQNIDAKACLLVDERGLLISEYIKNNLDKKAIAIMSSLLNGTGNKFINTLKLKKLNLITIETSKGTFLIKEIPLIQNERKFILCIFIEHRNSKNKFTISNFLGFLIYHLRYMINTLFNSNYNGKHQNYKKYLNEIVYKIQNLFITQ